MCDVCGCGTKAEQMASMETFMTDSLDTLGIETSLPLTSAPQHNIGE